MAIQGQFHGYGRLPYGRPIGGPYPGSVAQGPHIGGRQHPGTGTGVYPQFPPEEKPVRRPNKPRPPVSRPVVPVVTHNPIYPDGNNNDNYQPANPPTERIIPVIPVNPNRPMIPVNPNRPVIPDNPITGVAGRTHITLAPAPTVEFKPIVPVITRRPFRPPPPKPRITEPPATCTMHEQNPCSNHGVCYIDPFTGKALCQCRDLYAGNKCELVLKPPKNITMVDVASTYVSISWMPPFEKTKEITGFVVQYNKFGDQKRRFSPNIHPGVTDYTLRVSK